mmetsp:Transcript_27559/g.64685  ORF Transcript_27559/g.64685 Transcript_27559/m.64685 type:complete len:972 (-) Transcript_27559:174-3089(-)
MSKDSSSSPLGKLSGKASGGGSAGSGDASTKPLTPEELREQRLARLEGGNKSQGQAQKPRLEESQLASNIAPVKKMTAATTNKIVMQPPPYATFSGNITSNPFDTGNSTKPKPTTEKAQEFPPSSPIIDDDISDISKDIGNIDGVNAFPTDAELAKKEEEDLQVALALSMGLPVPNFVPKPAVEAEIPNIEPLSAFGTEPGREETTSPINGDMLATAAMVVATSPALGYASADAAPSMPVRTNDEPVTDMDMESDDRKPAAVDRTPKAGTSPSKDDPPSPSRVLRSNPEHFSGRVRTWYETASSYNVLDFHDCMWDKGVTTENDQVRWLAQGIQFKHEHDDRRQVTKTEADGATAANNSTNTPSLLETIISGPGVWCLTQQHGGPCGVLASIQAELLGILLFGPRNVHPLSLISIDFPDDLSTEFTKAPPDMSRHKMRQVLALSMGMILARSSLMASASLQDDNTTESDGYKVDEKDDMTVLRSPPEPSVRLVLPKNELWDTTNHLEWQHLEPWNCSDGGGGVSDHFLTYTISMNGQLVTGGGDDNNITVKRQKRGQDPENKGYTGHEVDVEYICKELAHATAQFLLETNSLNWFQRPGGVLLMVMSIAASRGIPKVQGDMDDLTARLTSNFGHCSQELINLLLTGRAVSNVFDHTLRPSGELVCRGIQSQPAIGYLTQLEAMRYLEVGGFYKSPRFPVWVIGSTSHFSVMFGDSNALKESASDVLLEKVRRAFKRMDGGAEENGFIQTNQLGDFLKSLDLNNVSDHEVQTLSAVMDRYGAGIILWEDLWKKTSRLLTGASLDSILNGTDEEPAAAAAAGGASNAATAGDTNSNGHQMSDEELARKLQAEWNDEYESELLGPSSIANTFDSTPTDAAMHSTGTNPNAASAERFGRTFQLYHYNGLRGGCFKAFRVTRLSADEAIGASISLGGSNQVAHNAVGFGGEFDTVLRTKWPSCKIDWLGGSPPSID